MKDKTQGQEAQQQDAEKPTYQAKGKKSLQDWNDLVTQRIEEAQRDGAFDNLPGHGKPLKDRRNPYLPEEMQLAFNMLEDNDLPPAWIGDRKEIQANIGKLRANMQRHADWHRTQLADAAANAHEQRRLFESWKYYVQQWAADVTDLNKRILTLNLKQPIVHLELFQLRLDEELTRIGMGRTLETVNK